MIKVGVRESVPVCGVKFILGNDVAGGKVIPFLEVCDKPDLFNQLDEMSERFPEVFPVCVVTRAQARKLVDADDLASTFMASTLERGILIADEVKTDEKSDFVLNDVKLPVTRNNIVAAQEADMTLRKCFSSVVPLEIAHERKTAYYVDNGLLMRRWCTMSRMILNGLLLIKLLFLCVTDKLYFRWPMTMLCLDTWALRNLPTNFEAFLCGQD